MYQVTKPDAIEMHVWLEVIGHQNTSTVSSNLVSILSTDRLDCYVT